MKRTKLRFKKRMALLLSFAMVAGLVPAMSGGANTVQAATGSGTEPSVSAYATKEQMMGGTFAPDSNGNATTIGKLVFGKNQSGTAQKWYILGKDTGVSGDNTILFAASPIATGQKFSSSKNNKTDSNLWSDCTYRGGPVGEVFANHYGASDLRVALKSMATNISYFTTAEQGLMNDTTVTTKDTNNSATYTTTDKLYALASDGDFSSCQIIKAGSGDSTVLAMNIYWSSGARFWLRSPDVGYDNYAFDKNALFTIPGDFVDSEIVNVGYAVQPASNLNLSSVLFASAATAASSDTAESGTIADGKAMTLRLSGTGKNIGTVTYNTTTGDIKATKGSTEGDVALVVQGNDGTNDWYYSKKIDTSETVNASAIKSALDLSSDIDLSACKIWLEITEDNVSYAVDAEKEIEKINTTYVTKEQLMNSFKPYSDGTAVNYGKIVFGKNSSGASQEWYILGKDEFVSGDNTILFAASPIATGQKFSSSKNNKTDSNLWSDCTYRGGPVGEVFANHYGASDLRVALKSMATNISYFTTAEQGLMNATTVTTKDTNNSATYTTTDKLYALAADGYGSSYTTIKAGTSDSTVLAVSSYWSSGDNFWLRSPIASSSIRALLARPGFYDVYDVTVDYVYAVQPASNLNLSSVLFASAATAASSDTAVLGTIADGKAMTLRFDGTGKNIGLVTYNTTTGDIKAAKGSTSKTVALVVQGNDGTNDWYYSKKIDASETVNASAIKSALDLSSDIDLSACKIWLEITEDNVSYAVDAEKEIEKINTTYVTKEQLMSSFKPYSDGTSTNIGKLVFGKKSDGTTAQEWYILGKDEGVSGDNTIIFAASPIAKGQKFSSSASNKTYNYEAGTGYGDPAGSKEVYANHYGASDLRAALQRMLEDEDGNTVETYFSEAEQGLMNDTTVTTNDTKNSVTYTTTDKLYTLAADGSGSSYKTIKAGTSDSTVLAMDSYWSSGDWFWLRSPCGNFSNFALLAFPGIYVDYDNVSNVDAVQPASNLNLSSVLFASAATAASSGTVVADTITSGTAMTLRLDGTGKNIGTVTYNTTTGDIKATKGSTEGDVALVVQGNDGPNDWYYSKQITGTEVVNVTDIVSDTNTPTSIDLSTCKIWLEITDTDGLIYAAGATEILSITSVAITDIETPAPNTSLDTEASCVTEGVSSTTPKITWAPSDSTAGYNTSYTASITLTAGTGYEFINSTTATVSGNNATGVTKNDDGTLTVTYAFSATAKRKIDSVTAPTAPTTFTTYYDYDGYAAILSDGGNSELGEAATVTFEGTVEPTTEDMKVTWTVANADDAPYDKTPGAENTFRWTIPASEFPDYDASACQGYDTATETITGTVTITNKAATPVTITGTDSSISYAGATIDVSQYFTIDSNAGTATYSLVTGKDGGTGEGEISGTTLTVNKTGTFKIKVDTAANGIYGAGEGNITLKVEGMIGDVNGDNLVTAEDALAILKHVVGLEELTGARSFCANVNADEGITAEDALDVLKKVVGLIDKFKAEE